MNLLSLCLRGAPRVAATHFWQLWDLTFLEGFHIGLGPYWLSFHEKSFLWLRRAWILSRRRETVESQLLLLQQGSVPTLFENGIAQMVQNYSFS